jgi:hypothetical protein
MKRAIALLIVVCAMLTPVFTSQIQAAQAGAVIIRDEQTYWDFIFPELVAMEADVVKFHLSYDNQWENGWPTHFVIPAAHLQGAIDAGAQDLILRSAETHITKDEINHFIQGMTFWDTGERLVDFIYNHRNDVHCWVEIGNEPDLHGADPWVHRYHLINVADELMDDWDWLWTMHWIASAPAQLGTHTDIFYHENQEGSVQDKYEAIGTHEYGDYDFSMGVTNRALNEISAGHSIWVTEAGINHDYDWGTKGVKYRQAVQNSDPRIRGWTFFTLTRDAYWNTCPNPDGSCLRYGIDMYYGTSTPISGRPCATELGNR